MSEEIWTEIRVRVGTTIYKGHYRVERDEVVVRRARGSKSAQHGAMPAEVLAETLLRELVAEGKAAAVRGRGLTDGLPSSCWS